MAADLSLICAAVLGLAVLLYVALDGFDLGVGLLLPLAKDGGQRRAMMACIAPPWDGAEIWLVLAVGGLLVAFPGAFAVLLSALALPGMLALAGLALRAAAALAMRGCDRRALTIAFFAGSLAAVLGQGFVLGGLVQGVRAAGDRFLGGPLDWARPYAVLIALALAAGYALLGAAWLAIKAQGELRERARRWVQIAAVAFGLLLAAVSLATLFVDPVAALRWGVGVKGVDAVRLVPLLPIPAMGLAGVLMAFFGAASPEAHPHTPMVGGLLALLSGYVGLAMGLVPFVAPYALTYAAAAASPAMLARMLAGAAALALLALAYTVWIHRTWRRRPASPDPASRIDGTAGTA